MGKVKQAAKALTAPEKAARIRELNDAFRKTFAGGRVMMTSGVAALAEETKQRIVSAIKNFTEFDKGDDPYSEHDFVSVEVDSEKYFWKCDYYDRDIRFGADDPSDPEHTTRIATIMRADEY
jgi:hypothetical protein